MKQIVLHQPAALASLYPFTRTRHTADIPIGILTIREKWERLTGAKVRITHDQESVTDSNTISIPANIIPTGELAKMVMETGQVPQHLPEGSMLLEHPWQIFQYTDKAIRQDFELLKDNLRAQPIPEAVQVILAKQIFVEPGAKLNHCMLNASTGPIYIAKDAEIMEGSFIRGPFALGEGSVVKMGARIYGATAIGPHCVVGGEIKNSVIFGYSNKAHDGYLGDSVIGEWCNLGAGTSNSNLKNTAGEVKVWDGLSKQFMNAGQKCGLLMGDYSRAAINSAFNTGTVVGVCCNVFGTGLSPKHIPDFTWGDHTLPRYEFEKALKDIATWKKLKNQSLSETEIQQLKTIFDEL
jgi:UDP-N-acetylglucosamine diphosphorylase / glucose-1-phosphate thymidylyltransferase / UDP-N-acetylgalactosamine diphosphorylase / glucosamine-1-phosphate N-acetyltransferase / galactosamine-1-phosphate N-acetyltransferase